MKRQMICIMLLLALLGVLINCDGNSKETPIPELGINLLIDAEGVVTLERENWITEAVVSVGTEIRRGDLLRPVGQTTILCADLSLAPVEQMSGCPCQVDEPVLLRNDVRVISPKSGNTLIPYILYPRRTKVLDGHPLLRWHNTGAPWYTVAIVQGGEAIWQQSVSSARNEMPYPADAPALRPDTDYLLVVKDEATGRESSEEPAHGLGFQVLSDEKRTTIWNHENEILNLPLNESARGFALAVYYAAEGLRGDALMLLDEISGTLETPAIHLWRGDLLYHIALFDEATIAYRVALDQAEAIGDLESQAMAHLGLGRTLTDPTQASRHYDDAIELCEQLGDTEQADKIRDER